MIGVDFLDEHLRERLTYQFQQVAPGNLFLSMAVHRTFDEKSDSIAEGTSYLFNEDGRLTITRRISRLIIWKSLQLRTIRQATMNLFLSSAITPV